jgi:Na+/proline symporter
MGRPDHRAERVVRTARRTLVAIGALAMAYAVTGALADTDVHGGVLVFLAGVLLAHDGILLPVAIGAGALVGRLVPPRLRAPVRAGLLASLAVTLVAIPLVLGPGRAADNPSLLPLPYGRGLLELYAIIWAAVAVAAVRSRRARRTRA